jgi:ATP-dependent DNA ligase
MTGPDRFTVIVEAAARLKAQSFLIDGEVVIARDDRTPGDSTLVQRAISFQRQCKHGCLSRAAGHHQTKG